MPVLPSSLPLTNIQMPFIYCPVDRITYIRRSDGLMCYKSSKLCLVGVAIRTFTK